VRSVAPVPVVVVTTWSYALAVVIGLPSDATLIEPIAPVLAVYSLGEHAPARRLAAGLIAALAAYVRAVISRSASSTTPRRNAPAMNRDGRGPVDMRERVAVYAGTTSLISRVSTATIPPSSVSPSRSSRRGTGSSTSTRIARRASANCRVPRRSESSNCSGRSPIAGRCSESPADTARAPATSATAGSSPSTPKRTGILATGWSTGSSRPRRTRRRSRWSPWDGSSSRTRPAPATASTSVSASCSTASH